MIGAGERMGNTTPPSIAVPAFATAQAGLLLAAEPPVARPRPWRRVARLNPAVITVYLWHMVPAVVIAIALYPAGIMPQPPIGSAQWWTTRPAWFAILMAVLVPLTWLLMWAQRPLARLPTGLGTPGPWSPALLGAGTAGTVVGLARLAIGGFAPGAHPALTAVAVLACGILATISSGHPGAKGTSTALPAWQPHASG